MNKNQLKQFIIANIYAKQGFSVNADGIGSRNGYMCGFNNAVLIRPVEEFKASEVDDWVELAYPTLTGDKNLYAGGWLFEDNYYLEISRNIGVLLAARDFAAKHGEIAIFDCEAQQVITIHNQN